MISKPLFRLITVVGAAYAMAACSPAGSSAIDTTEAEVEDGVDSSVEPDLLEQDESSPDVRPEETLPEDTACVPDCSGKECGSDGCKGTCGNCKPGSVCQGGVCKPDDQPCKSLEECLPYVCDSGECTPCTSDAQCAPADKACNKDTGLCVDCSDSLPCGEGFVCVNSVCMEPICPEVPCEVGLVCDTKSKKCVKCLGNDDCPPNQVCEGNVCKAISCVSSKDCPTGLICDKQNASCVECIESIDCPEGYKCNKQQVCYKVIPCTSDKDCTPLGMVCNKAEGECVDCLLDADCADNNYCLDMLCLVDACDQSATWPQCKGNSIMSCSPNGAVLSIVETCGEEEICQDAQCAPWLCKPESVGCADTIAYTCNKLGNAYKTQVDCALTDQTCSLGECKDVVCDPSAIFCLDPAIQIICSANGTEFEPKACEEGTYCDDVTDSCKPWVCKPGQKLCQGDKSVTCNVYGSGFTNEIDCKAQGLVCVAGVCIDCDPACGDKQCGPDACGSLCGTCLEAQQCVNGYCYGDLCSGACVGKTAEAYTCALDICLKETITGIAIASPTGDDISSAWAAVAHFGSLDNGLKPRAGSSYALLATGPAEGTSHSTDLPGGGSTSDPFSTSGTPTFDNVEVKLNLVAPKWAKGFAVDYVFLSEEYEEWIGTNYSDKFYMILTAPTTTAGKKQVINYGPCVGNSSDLTDPNGQKACYISVNSGFSEKCTDVKTSIAGTGFECGPPDAAHGSSTGWLTTSWTIVPGETFELVFHIHDSGDGIYDSEVILDNFRWLTSPPTSGTVKL